MIRPVLWQLYLFTHFHSLTPLLPYSLTPSLTINSVVPGSTPHLASRQVVPETSWVSDWCVKREEWEWRHALDTCASVRVSEGGRKRVRL